MDFDILYAIQAIRTPFLDKCILALTTVMGSYGTMWIIIAVPMLFFKKTRRAGIAVLLSYLLVFGVGQYVLKDWIARPRPCHLDETVSLLVARPASYSCPSTHSAWAFAAATSVLLYFRKWGIVTMIVAALIGFSRMYLFVHFPSDVLFGAVLGVLLAIAAVKLVNCVFDRRKARAAKTA